MYSLKVEIIFWGGCERFVYLLSILGFTMTSVNQAAETLRQYLLRDSKGRQTCFIPEGKFKGWVPRTIYEVKSIQIKIKIKKNNNK